METTKLRIEKTKQGYPALWEDGGSATNTGESTIVAGGDGLPKRAIYIKRAGHLSNGRHALIVLEIGDHIVEASHHRKDFRIQIYQVVDFEVKEETYAITKLINHFSRGEWDVEPPAYLNAAIEAAIDKSTCYHCRSAFYVSE